MATFKVGDRVRIITTGHYARAGDEGIVVLPLGLHAGRGQHQVPRYGVDVVGRPCPIGPGTHALFLSSSLAPLTPPAEDAWAADAVRKVTRPVHVEPVVVKEKA